MATVEFSEDGMATLRGQASARFQEFFDRHTGASPDEIRAAWRKELGGEPSEMIVAAIHHGEATAGGL